MTYRILCVDPDEGDRTEAVERLREELADLDPVFQTADDLASATEALTQHTAVVVTEYDLPDGNGFQVIEQANERCPDAGVILYTDTDPDLIDTAELRGAVTEYVGKDSVFGTERLAELVRTTVEERTQSSYPLPQTEDERLAALHSYDLDEPALLDSLDRITDLAAEHFDVEQASINIISEHSQDFLACYGRAEQWESMDREDSICTFTILEEDNVMTVPDVTEDPRFESRSETLIEMGIRSYMGANLVAPSGLVIGPLCVYDTEPRSFSAADEAYLQKLAATAMDLIDLHGRLDATTEGKG
ncbi:GAF domain-containing protein [Halovenus sp. WSH3]|uniref:GAF domain-containing protein n=1 Tax=Halovenus carboxidivorans TaxID=2692199 RepID=A0A6B0SZ56_9EURY|nr:GAF domain-containing protein [Halovenus carboxidivorans]MXR50914.1 GAF domain-containing protein [Halovenus carboxidivorans]